MAPAICWIFDQSMTSNLPITATQNPKSKTLLYHICPTVFGYGAILFQTRPFLVKSIFLPRSHKSPLTKDIQRVGPAEPGHTPAVLNLCKVMKLYFKGVPVKTPWKFLDLGGLTPLQRAVLETVAEVPRGEVRSYGEIAAQVGHPRASRFIGTTLAQNPFPIFIPCHRIVRTDGSLGGFSGGTDLKKRMLALEKRKE
jgi:methylated-DNA-[protein]-cysteine S-methyltransferase